jgi:hypothetical protein
MANQKRKTHAAGYQAGDKACVRHGVMDTNFPDIPIGGWAGTIAEVPDDGIFTVRGSRETLASIHPVFRKRCEKDGLDFETYWVGADDLEPDTGGHAPSRRSL